MIMWLNDILLTILAGSTISFALISESGGGNDISTDPAHPWPLNPPRLERLDARSISNTSDANHTEPIKNTVSLHHESLGFEIWGLLCGERDNFLIEVEYLEASTKLNIDQVSTIRDLSNTLSASERPFRYALDVSGIGGKELIIDLSLTKSSVSLAERDVGSCMGKILEFWQLSQAESIEHGLPRETFIGLRKPGDSRRLVSGYIYLAGRNDPPDSIYPIKETKVFIGNITFMYPPNAKSIRSRAHMYMAVRDLERAVMRARADGLNPHNTTVGIEKKQAQGIVIATAQLLRFEGIQAAQWQILERCVGSQARHFGLDDIRPPKRVYEGIWTCHLRESGEAVAEGSFRLARPLEPTFSTEEQVSGEGNDTQISVFRS